MPNGWGHFQTGVYVGNLRVLQDGGSNWLNFAGKFHASGQLIVDGHTQFNSDTYATGLVTGKAGGSFGEWNVGGTDVTICWDCNVAGDLYSGGSVNSSNARLQSGAQPGGGGASELWMNSSNAAKYGTMWLDLSDARIKDDIQPFERGLADIRQLRPTTYRYNGAHGTFVDGKRHTGLIAQDVQQVMPEMIGELAMTMVPLTEPILTVDCGPLLYAMLNAIKELAQRLETIEKAT